MPRAASPLSSSICIALLFLATHGNSFEAEWELKRDQDGIQVLTGPVEGSSFKAVRSVVVLDDAKLGQLVAIIRDTRACHELSKLCKQAYEHEVISETEMYLYNLNDLPWPVADRDAVTHVLWSYSPATDEVTMVATVVGDVLPKAKRTVRLTYGVTRWVLKSLDNGRVEVVSESHIDPEGNVPAWITNRLLIDAPFETMENVRSLVAQGRHRNATFEFMRPQQAGDSEN